MSWTRVDVSPTGGDGQLFAVTVAGHDLCLGMVAGIWYAIEDLCTHEECPLSDGFLDGVEGLTIAQMAALYNFVKYVKALNMSWRR